MQRGKRFVSFNTCPIIQQAGSSNSQQQQQQYEIGKIKRVEPIKTMASHPFPAVDFVC